MKDDTNGWTLTELLLTVVILSIITLGIGTFLTQGIRHTRTIIAKTDIQREARTALSMINKELRQGVANSVEVSRYNSSMPPYSKIKFNTIKGATVYYYQDGVKLYQEVYRGNTFVAKTKLSENLRYIHFVYPQTDNDSIIQVSCCFEKIPFPYVVGAKALQVSIEKVRIMN